MSVTPGPVPVAVPVLPVSDLARSLAWYGRLGFTSVAEFDGYAIVSFAGAELHLSVDGHPLSPGDSRSGAYLRVDDADVVHTSWSAMGVRTIKGPNDEPYGIREFATEDPDGNLWRVGSPIAAPPGAEVGVVAGGPPSPDGTAPTDGSPGTGDEAWRDVAEADGPCAGCGLTASAGPVEAVRTEILAEVDRWARLLRDGGDEAIRHRPHEHTWSALEYAFHVKGVLGVFTERIARTLVEPDPELGWWDHESAVDDGMANELDAELIVDDLRRNAENLGDVLARVDGVVWDRPAKRRGEAFTVASMARFAWHETVHHRVDAENSLAGR